MPVEAQPAGGGRLPERRGRHQCGLAADRAEAPQRSEDPHRDLGRRAGARRLVVGRLVEVEHGVQVGVERRQRRIGKQRVGVQAAHTARLEQERGPHPVLGDESLDDVGELGPVEGRQRMAEAADLRQHHIDVVVERGEHAVDEARVQQRHVRGRGVGGRRALADGGQPCGQPLERAAALARIVDQLDPFGQLGQRLPRSAHHDDRAVDRTPHDADDAPQQRRAMPLQRGLGRAHPRRAPTGEHDACHPRHAGVQPPPIGIVRITTSASAGKSSTGSWRPSPPSTAT